MSRGRCRACAAHACVSCWEVVYHLLAGPVGCSARARWGRCRACTAGDEQSVGSTCWAGLRAVCLGYRVLDQRSRGARAAGEPESFESTTCAEGLSPVR